MEIIERGRSKIKLIGCLFIGSSLLTIILHKFTIPRKRYHSAND